MMTVMNVSFVLPTWVYEKSGIARNQMDWNHERDVPEA